MTMKEIKEEDFDDFLQEYSRRPREDDSTSKEEMSSAIKMEEESNVTGNSHDGMKFTSKVSESSKLVTMKKEIKEEDIDYFLREYLWQPRQDDSTSKTTCKEEISPAMDIKVEEESNVAGNSHDGMKFTSKVSESSKPVTIKQEIKEDIDFLQEYLWQPQQDDSTSRTTCKEEISPAMDIKEEEESNAIGNSHDGMKLTSKESESSQLVTCKKEIKIEDFEVSLHRMQENDETKSSVFKEENCSSVDIEEEIDYNLIENGNNDMPPTSAPAVNMHAGRTLQCTTCGKVFTHAEHLRRHQRLHTHSGEKTYPCKTCGKYFTTKHTLQVHLKIHTEEKPFPCTACGKTFLRKADLQKHLRIHTGEKPFSCTTCGNSFRLKSVLQEHLRMHTGEIRYQCATCGKAFTQKCDLQNHLMIHTGERPFLCKTCGKSFRVGSTLRKHQMIHTDERPNTCITCGKSFREGGTLRRHQRIHTDEKPYLCTTCGRAFRVASNLRRHQMIHTGEKPYVCATCGKAFTQAGNLRIHQSTHNGEKSM
ncbi:zinc finger protein 226-like [Engraulis encrasicolus]|uniref:zinc finger protein 226-like n=1 Tax=Engraulis encrasicolus TaxID=184585 RepID=UPI002FD71C34